jgi:ATP-dependent Zn protease
MPASRNKRRIFIIVISVFLIAGAAYLFFGDQIFSNDGFSAANQETYAAFYKCVENQTVEKVKISEDKIEYWLKGSDVKYITQNPESPSLKETLLKNNVQVESSKSSSQIISFISDMFFYIFIAAILILAFKKVFSPTAFKVQHKTGK